MTYLWDGEKFVVTFIFSAGSHRLEKSIAVSRMFLVREACYNIIIINGIKI